MNATNVARNFQAHIGRFSGGLSKGLCVKAQRFPAEMVYRIQASESVMLTEVARTLEEKTSMKKTKERLLRNSQPPKLEVVFQENVLRRLFRSFQLAVFRKLYVSDYVFGQQLSLAYRFIFNRRELFPDDCLCPQCGFHRFGEARCEGDRASEPWGAVKRGMQKIVPRRKVAWWIVALYERTA